MTAFAYYNEIDPVAAEWLRWLIAQGRIACGFVDTRSIIKVQPDDIIGNAINPVLAAEVIAAFMDAEGAA